MSTNVNRVGRWVKKGQKSVNIVCERPLRILGNLVGHQKTFDLTLGNLKFSDDKLDYRAFLTCLDFNTKGIG